MSLFRRILVLAFIIPLIAGAGPPQPLSADSFAESGIDRGIVVLGINWNRMWDCGGYENAQLQRLSFLFVNQLDAVEAVRTLDFEIPHRLGSTNSFTEYEMLLEPGVYALSGFDIKVAESVARVFHLVTATEQLIGDGEPLGGTFSVSRGEIVYIGHFELDCVESPIPWRYYIDDRKRFESFIAKLRKEHPYLTDTPAQFRLFSTTQFGTQFSLDGRGNQ